jgi:FMN-dependent oxidoreductase (nitrilotriacetate monooxygenase family)
MFHLAWFLGNGYGIQPWNSQAWNGTWNGANGQDWMRPDLYVDLTSSLERGGFDYLLIEDTSMIEDTYGGSMKATLGHGYQAPKNDPLPLVPLLTQQTRHIGIVPTISTIAYPPFLAARLLTTLDHITEGRIGVNVVTSVSNRVAQNFGLDAHHEHDVRYEMADEWLDVVEALWSSWDHDAIRLDEIHNVYADHEKVHTIDFEGRFFKCRGPLNTIPGPQRKPLICQAGSSDPGRDLAARHADTMLALATNVDDMKAFRADMHRRLLENGRKPSDCKILYLVQPIVARTDAEALELDTVRRNMAWHPAEIEIALMGLSYVSGGLVDFAQFDLDEPLPDTPVNGEQSTMASFRKAAGGKTLRELAATHQAAGGELSLVGSPDTVAAKMGEIMEEVGGDGFLLFPSMTRHVISEITDGLSPALRRRGLIRDGYDSTTLRENLLDF